MIKMQRSNLQSFCRTCLGQLQSTSATTFNINQTPNLAKLLIICTSLNINEDTDAVYPQNLCPRCYNILQQFRDFRIMAQQSEEVLRKIVEADDKNNAFNTIDEDGFFNDTGDTTLAEELHERINAGDSTTSKKMKYSDELDSDFRDLSNSSSASTAKMLLDAVEVTINDHNVGEEEFDSRSKTASKRSRKPELWKRNMNKKLRMSGQEYINRVGKLIVKKTPKIVDCSNCRFKCGINFSDETREKLCTEFWNIGDTTLQKIFLSTCLQISDVKRRRTNAGRKRAFSVEYFLVNDGNRIRVCLKFVCATFSISHRFVESCLKDISDNGLYSGYDRRQRKMPHNKTDEKIAELVREHIYSFADLEATQNCRNNTMRTILAPDLKISKMYRLYETVFCAINNVKPVSLDVYSKIFYDYMETQCKCLNCNTSTQQ